MPATPVPTTTTRRPSVEGDGHQSTSSASATRGLLTHAIGRRRVLIVSQQILQETQYRMSRARRRGEIGNHWTVEIECRQLREEPMILRWAAIIAAILWPPLQPAALGQNFPAKPIRMIIAESSGSGADILARQIGGQLTQAWGQSVVVDSRTGASGLIAAELVARSAPDGYTIWMATMTQLISTTMYQR